MTDFEEFVEIAFHVGRKREGNDVEHIDVGIRNIEQSVRGEKKKNN